MTPTDPTVKNYTQAATALAQKLLDQVAERDPGLYAAVLHAHSQGERLSLSMTTGGMRLEIELASVSDYGSRRPIATITGEAPRPN